MTEKLRQEPLAPLAEAAAMKEGTRHPETAMGLSTALGHLQRLSAVTPAYKSPALFVKVLSPGSVGGTPCVAITAIQSGFDWDAGKLILQTETPLTRLSAEDVHAIQKSAKEGYSWHALKAQEKQAKRIKDLENEVAELKEANAAGWDNFNALAHINDWLIERGLLVCVEDGDAMAAARNVTRSLELMRTANPSNTTSLPAEAISGAAQQAPAPK